MLEIAWLYHSGGLGLESFYLGELDSTDLEATVGSECLRFFLCFKQGTKIIIIFWASLGAYVSFVGGSGSLHSYHIILISFQITMRNIVLLSCWFQTLALVKFGTQRS